MERPSTDGVVTFDQFLHVLHRDGQTSLEVALRNGTSENNCCPWLKFEATAAQDRKKIGVTLSGLE